MPHDRVERGRALMMASGRKTTVALDVRCLQDPGYARRGVGRHVLALLRGAPAHVRLLGLADPNMPPIIEEAEATLAEVRHSAYACRFADERPQAFVSLSPMTHDPLFAARLLGDAGLLRTAVIYDFIPRHEPQRYLPGPVERLSYATALAWLRRCDLFASISQSSADELRDLFGVPQTAIAVTGAPLDPRFETGPSIRGAEAPAHLLVVGGGDARKNPEVVIRAHAQSAMLQSRSVPLVIAGNYQAAEADAFCAVATMAGGRADLVQVPGHVSDDALVALYARALAIVCPSRDEGFSLPVVEGMAAGALCITSDIPAHRELVHDRALRFPPLDEAALALILERTAVDDNWRANRIAAQATVWPRFRAKAVSTRFWTALLSRVAAAPSSPAVLRGARPRVALASPLPPERSGVADYTAAACGPLSDLVELHLFTTAENPRAITGAAGIAPMSTLPYMQPTFDRVIGVLGNSHFHLPMFEALMRHGGACVAHDARMAGFYRVLLGLERTLATASRELGRQVDEPELNMWLSDEGKLEALFLGELVERATPCIVHSPVTTELCASRYGIRPDYVPFSIYRPWSPHELNLTAREAARARLGLRRGEIAIASFGFVQASKAPEECIWALDLLRGWGLPASLHFVGDTDSMPDKGATLHALVDELGLGGKVTFADSFVPEQVYRDYLIGADVSIQLRTYTLGGLSGGLLDCAAVGLPVVANSSLAATVLPPPSYTRRIPDALSPVLLAEAVAELVESGPTPRRREEDRRAFTEERSMRAYARHLCAALGLEVGTVPYRKRANA